jgi:Plasma-membrane choline transporter
MFINRTAGSNPATSDPIMAAAVRSYGTTAPHTVTMDDRQRPGDEVTPLIAVSEVITGDYDAKEGDPVYRDVPFAVLFLIHLCIMLWLGIFVAPAGYEKLADFNFTSIENEIRKDGDDSISDEDLRKMEAFAAEASDYLQVYPYRIVVNLVLPCLLISFLLAFVLTAAIIKPYTTPFVYSSLVGSIVGTAIMMISMAVASHSLPMYCLTGLSLLGVLYYVRLAWAMVPFAAVNLKVALTGITMNWGMYIIAFVFAQLGFLWNIYWVYVLIGLASKEDSECLEAHPDVDFDSDTCSPPPFVILALLLSLYWTSTIIMVSLHNRRASFSFAIKRLLTLSMHVCRTEYRPGHRGGVSILD